MTAATATSTLPAGSPAAEGARAGFRPEVQGLRAVAVLLVVLFHLWPNRLSGGFVGVDVFFVISGFLITAHIHREVEATGTVRLRRFWARRIRRLLPASLLVLALSAVAVIAVVPATMWTQSARQIAASALYVQNWALAADSVDYMAADNVPTVAQHYWSLSVEEQFYLVWPVLLLGLAWWHRRSGRPAAQRRWFLVAGLGALAGASLVWSVVATYDDQSLAYFVTPTRVWEFAAGGLLALLGAARLRGTRWAAVLAWLGLGGILVAGVLYDGASMFPGWIALLPVLGTVAVIAAGPSDRWWAPARWLSLRPATFVGDISYSVYLWHWPLIVVLPFVTGLPLRTTDKLAIIVATLLLAWASKVWVEDPARVRPLLAAAPWRSFAFAVAGMAVVVVAGVGIQAELDRRADQAAEHAAESAAAGCLGPTALEPANDCDPIEGDGAFVVPPEVVVQQNTEPLYRGCQANRDADYVATCTIGYTGESPERVVAVVGDSHASQWFPALDELGQELSWQVQTYTKSSCPFTVAHRVLENEQTDDPMLGCAGWIDEVRDTLVADDEVSYVFTAAFTSAYGFEAPSDQPLTDPSTDGFAELWEGLRDAGLEVFAIADVPRTQGDNVPNCLAASSGDRMACATPRAEALPGSALAAAARASDDPGVHLIDLTNRFCDDAWCYPVVGDLIVYRDYSHLSAEYARALVPDLKAAVTGTAGRPLVAGCHGPAALDEGNSCDPVQGDGSLEPPVEVAAQQSPNPPYPGCQQVADTAEVVTCSLGTTDGEASHVVAVMGDSHATHLFPAMDELGRRFDWEVVTYTKTACPVSESQRVLESEQTDARAKYCHAWGESIRADMVARGDIEAVFTAANSHHYTWRTLGGGPAVPGQQGFIDAWRDLTSAGIELFVVADVPETQGSSVPDCLALSDDRMDCAMPRDDGVPPSLIVDAATRTADDAVEVIDLTDRFCDDQWCYPVVGDMIVYRDATHLTYEYSKALAPYIAAQLVGTGLVSS